MDSSTDTMATGGSCVDLYREKAHEIEMERSQTLNPLDIVVILMYFVLVLIVGFASLFRSNRGNAQGYFLAGGNMHWFPVGASIFASNIGSKHFISLAGAGAASGIAGAAFELNAIPLVIVMAWIFLPVYLASSVYTMPEYLGKRFGGQRLRMYTAGLSLLIYIFSKISIDFFAGAIYIQQALGWNLYLSITVLLAVTALYTVTGGLAAVVYTDTLQTVIMLIGAGVLAIMGYKEVGGLSGLEEKYMNATSFEAQYCNTTCGLPSENAFVMLRSPGDPNMPWPGFIFGMSTASLWYWGTDQVIVQRALAAKNLSHGKGGAIFSGLCKITPLFFMVFPGMIARVLFPETVGCVDPDVCKEICGIESGCSNLAYPLLVMNLLPIGLRGLMLAVILSALMSSLTSIFNSSSTIFTMDIWRKLRKIPDDAQMNKLPAKQKMKYDYEMMLVGRIFTLVLVVLSVLWIPMISKSPNGQLVHYTAAVASFVATPLAATFTLGILWGRVNEPGAFWACMIGLVVGGMRFALDMVYESIPCGFEDTRPIWVQHVQIQYMYFALFLFSLTALCAIAISLCTDPIPPECLYRLTFWTRFSREERKDISAIRTEDGKHTNVAYEMTGINGANEDHGKSDENPEDSTETTKKAEAKWRHFFRWFCGFNSISDYKEISEDEKKEREEQQMDKLHETKRDKIILNICCVLSIIVAIILYTYWL